MGTCFRGGGKVTPPEGEGELGGKLEGAAGQGARPGKDPLGPLSIHLCFPSNVCTPVMQALPGSTAHSLVNGLMDLHWWWEGRQRD